MAETSKKRRKTTINHNNPTIFKRGLIDANWETLLSNLDIKKVDKSENKEKCFSYSRTFRGNKRNNEQSLPVNNSLKSFNIEDINVKSKRVKNKQNGSNADRKINSLTKFIALDCEMVGVGHHGRTHMLARVSLANKFGDCIYDKYVKPREQIEDYRTPISGITKEHLMNAEEFTTVQKEVADILKGRILVGHSVQNDLRVLFLSHPKKNIRDTSKYKAFKKITKGNTPSLKFLAKEILGINIQHGEHSSIEDAQATMKLYCTVAKNWELMLREKYQRNNCHIK